MKDILNGLHFDSFNEFSEDGTLRLYSSQSSKLCYKSDVDFLLNYLSKLCGLSRLVLNPQLASELSFDKLSFPEGTHSHITTVYEECYDEFKYQLTSQGNNINSLMKYSSINPSNPLGIIMHDSSEYSSFSRLIEKYILLSQSFDSRTTEHIHKPDEPKQMTEINDEELSKISNVAICLMRNIEGYAYPHSSQNSNAEVEEVIRKAITTINSKGHFADYFSLSEDETKEQALSLIENNKLMIRHEEKMSECSMDADYPKHRGVIQFTRENLFAVVNDIDHIRFNLVINEPKKKFGSSLVSLLKVVNEFSKHINFSYDMNLGFLTTTPKYLGTGLDTKLMLTLSNLTRENLQNHLVEQSNKQFNAVIVSSSEDSPYQVEITNKVTIGMSETELMINLLAFLNDIIKLDEGN